MRNKAVVRGVRTLFEVGTATGLSDGQLLEWYLRRGDDSAEDAFRALVERHGPMVLRACRGVLHDIHAAEDAFQATFLILARKAGAIRRRDSVASWLFGVARRVAGRAARQRGRREARERQGVEMSEAADRSSTDLPGSFPEVQEEVDRLPERYRAPVVLCYLEGLTQEEAAARLRLPASTVRVRLMRARERLRDRLTRRGLAPGALASLAGARSSAIVSAPLVDETVRAAIRFAVGRAAGASGPIAALAEGVIRTMFLARLKTVAALLAALSCASLGIIASLAGPSPEPPSPPAQVPAAPKDAEKPQAPGPEVGVEVVKRASWPRTTSQGGTVRAVDSASLYARTSGYLKTLKVDIGSRVKKGEILAEIDAPEVLADVARARAELERANARVKRARAAMQVAKTAHELDQAKVEVAAADLRTAEAQAGYRQKQAERLRELVERGSVEQRIGDEELNRLEVARGTVQTTRSQRAVAVAAEVAARARVDVAAAELDEAAGDLHVAQAGLDSQSIREQYTRIIAPFDGVVTRCNAHVGELVRSGDAGQVPPICTIVGTDRVRVVVFVPDRDTPFVDPGDQAEIWIDAFPDRPYEGRVARTAYELNTNSTLSVEIDLPNTDGRLRPGQSGRVEIQLEPGADAISVSGSAVIVEGPDGPHVCFRLQEGRVVRTPITVGRSDNARIEVTRGLKEGDVVITEWRGSLADGQRVTVSAKKNRE